MTHLNGLIWYGIPWIVGLVLMVWMKRVQDKDYETQRLTRESWDYDDDNLLGDFTKFLVLLIGVVLYLIGGIGLAHILGNTCLPNYFIAWQFAINILVYQGMIVYAIWKKKPDNPAKEASGN